MITSGCYIYIGERVWQYICGECSVSVSVSSESVVKCRIRVDESLSDESSGSNASSDDSEAHESKPEVIQVDRK